MSDSQAMTPAQKAIGDFAPKLVSLTDDVLFGDVWERTELSKRDRSLITVAALITNGSTEQLRGHLARAKDNGLRRPSSRRSSSTSRSTPAGPGRCPPSPLRRRFSAPDCRRLAPPVVVLCGLSLSKPADVRALRQAQGAFDAPQRNDLGVETVSTRGQPFGVALLECLSG